MNGGNKEEYLTRLAMAFRDIHTCEARHVGSMPILETFKGHIVWNGQVEIFELSGHPKARTGYAWSLGTDHENQTTTVLHISPVDSPRAAVQAAIASYLRNPH